jgi:hypothetical protein
VQTWNAQVADAPSLSELMPFLPTSWPVVTARAMPTAQASTNRPKLHQKVQYLATGPLWNAIFEAPEWPAFKAQYEAYREATYTADMDPGQADLLRAQLQGIAERIYARSRGVEGAASYVMMGSQNQDYRGMFMDGEVDLLFNGPESLVPLIDLLFLSGTSTLVTSQQTLDSLVTPPSEYWRRWARVLKDGV